MTFRALSINVVGDHRHRTDRKLESERVKQKPWWVDLPTSRAQNTSIEVKSLLVTGLSLPGVTAGGPPGHRRSAATLRSPARRRTRFHQRPSDAAGTDDSTPRIIKDRGKESYRPRRPRARTGLYKEGNGLYDVMMRSDKVGAIVPVRAVWSGIYATRGPSGRIAEFGVAFNSPSVLTLWGALFRRTRAPGTRTVSVPGCVDGAVLRSVGETCTGSG